MTAVPTNAATKSSAGPVRWLGMRIPIWALLAVAAAVLVLAWTPARLRYHLHRGQTELLQRKLDAAEREFLAARGISPKHAETYFWLARIGRKRGEVADVRRDLDEALRLGYPDRERLTREWWLLQAQTGQIAAVEDKLAGLLRDPGEDGVEICEAFAQGYCMNLQFEAALMLLEAWQTDYPQDYRPHLRRGKIFLEGNFKSSRAEEALREALRLAPHNFEVHRELGKALLTLRKLDEAKEQLRLAIEANPRDEESLLAMATTLQERDELEQARESVQRLLQLNPNHEKGQNLLSDLLIQSGEFEQAIGLLTPLVEQWPEDLKMRYNLAKALQRSGGGAEAERHFEEYAKLLESAERMHEINRQRERDPYNLELRYELGRLRLKHESRAEGAAWLQSVLLNDPNHQGAHQTLAEYYARIGKTDLARQHRLRLAQPPNSQELLIETTPPTQSESLP